MHLRGGAAFFALRRHVRKPCPIRCDRNADSEARRSKRLMRSGMRNHGSFEIVPRPGRHPPTAGPTEFCSILHRRRAARERIVVTGARATESCPERCATLPHERSGMPFFSRTAPVALSPYRRLAFTTAAHWLLLGLQQEAVDGLLETEIASAAPGGAAPTFSNARHDSDRPTLGEQGARWTALNHSAFGADDGLRGLRRANSANHEEGV